MPIRPYAAAVASALLLAACTTNADQPDDASPSGSSSPTGPPSPTPTGPSLPADARDRSQAAAEAFIKHYFATLSKAMVTGDPSDLEALSLPACESCSVLASRVRDIRNKGAVSTDGWQVSLIDADIPQTETLRNFVLSVNETPLRVTDGNGNAIIDEPGLQRRMKMQVRWEHGHWLAEGLVLLQ